MSNKNMRCPSCGGEHFTPKSVEYLYSHDGKYLLVPGTPAEICETCGMVFYDASVLENIERRFFAILRQSEQPDQYIQMPVAAYA